MKTLFDKSGQYIDNVVNTLYNLDFKQIQGLMEMIKYTDRVWIIGNGGSIATASHFAEDLLKLNKKKAFAISDAALISMSVNDEGIKNMFSYSLKILVEEDLVIGITMGGSENVLKAITDSDIKGHSFLITKGIKIVSFPNSIVIPTDDVQVAEDVCLSICHMICRFLGGSK